MGQNIVQSINEIRGVGKEQADQFMKERLVTKAKDIDKQIQKTTTTRKKQAIILFVWNYNFVSKRYSSWLV